MRHFFLMYDTEATHSAAYYFRGVSIRSRSGAPASKGMRDERSTLKAKQI